MEGQKVIVAQGPGDFAINLQEALVSPLQIRVSQGIPPVSPTPANWRQSQARHFAGPLASNIDFGDKTAHSAQKSGISGRIFADHVPPQTPSGDRHCPEIQGSCTTVAHPRQGRTKRLDKSPIPVHPPFSGHTMRHFLRFSTRHNLRRPLHA